MSWYAPGSGSGISVNPFTGLMNGSDGANADTQAGNGNVGHILEHLTGTNLSEQYNPTDLIDTRFDGGKTVDAQGVEPKPTLATYLNEHPDATPEEIMQYMAQHSEEWAEKYLDYLVERGELDKANEYTAQREDTAYQRLVEDLRKAGLNPAMMYGSTASTSASGSQGYIKMTEGANSRAVGNYSKIQKVLLGYLVYQMQKELGTANTVIKGVGTLFDFLGSLL